MKFIPLTKPSIGKNEINEVIKVLKSGWLTTGTKVKEFEEGIKKYIGCKKAIGVTSCTGGLHIALAVLGIGEGDEVIIPTLTFVASAHVVTWLNAKPILVDVEEDTYNIDPKEIEKAITPKTKAIMPVHYAGHPCDMNKIMKIAKKHKLFVVEDAAHAIGSKYKNKMIGTIGDITVFSFYATKNITTGEGGMVTTDNTKIANKIRKYSYFGINKDAFDRYREGGTWYYEIESQGYKYNMDNIRGPLGVEQLKKIERFNKKRAKLVARYTKALKNVRGIKLPTERKNIVHSWHLYAIVLERKKVKITRNEFIEKLKEMNIGTSVHFIPLHLHKFYQNNYGYKKGDFPVAEKIYNDLVSLPLYPSMTYKDVDYVVNCIKKILG